MKLLNYTLFEAKLRNISISNNDEINQTINKDFEINDFLPFIYIKDLEKIVHINWNHKEEHNIINKIKFRTEFSSIKEFNEILTNVLMILFTEKFSEIDETSKLYDLYLKETNVHILTRIIYDNLFESKTEILIVTILPQHGEVDKVITFGM